MYRDKRGNELAALKEIAEMLNSTNDMEQMLHDVLVKLIEVTGFSTGWIFMMDDSGENLCRAAYRLPEALNARNREVMGATNPADAAEGTIRKTYAESIEANSVHGSDSDENARVEIDFFFKPEEIVG